MEADFDVGDIGDVAASEAQRKLLDNVYDKNYSMTDCSKNMDFYGNVTLIDNAVNGPVVMMDIDTNDCDMIFDKWHIEKTVNLLNGSWNSENANGIGHEFSNGGESGGEGTETGYSFPYYAYGDEGGEVNYFLDAYDGYYEARVDYPDILSGYIPPALFFVYQYHEKNLGVVRIKNSRFENNDGFPIISCGAYSYCNIVMTNCVFKDNIFDYENETYYNSIWMQDNSYGKIIISDSKFIGDYHKQEHSYSMNWLYDSNENSIFKCNNCTFFTETDSPTTIPSINPTMIPTIATSEPTRLPSLFPTVPSATPTDIPSSIVSTEIDEVYNDDDDDSGGSTIDLILVLICLLLSGVVIWAGYYYVCRDQKTQQEKEKEKEKGKEKEKQQVEKKISNIDQNNNQTVEITTTDVQGKQGNQDIQIPQGTESATLGVKPSLSVSAHEPKPKGGDTVGLLDQVWSQQNGE